MPSTDKTILVIDDDYDLREAIKDLLGDEGYRVAIAADGSEGIEYLRAHPAPALILLDYWMPNLNGAAFVQKVKAEAAWADIPVALVTADAKAGELVERLGIEALLKKPVQLDDLLALVERFAARDR
jgi:CheY-like chemotaxis protein